LKNEYPNLPSPPADIPKAPWSTYDGHGWQEMGDWLGTGNIGKGDWRAFVEARKFVRKLGLKSQKEWFGYCDGEFPHLKARPKDIPKFPDQTYAGKGWKGTGDWLGTRHGRVGHWMPFEKARAFVRSLKLKNGTEWDKYRKGKLGIQPEKPADIPHAPQNVYRDKGWKGTADWIGSGRRVGGWRPHKDAREFARDLKLKSVQEWYRYINGELTDLPPLPNDIPRYPDARKYGAEWRGHSDFLGLARTREKWKIKKGKK
jgi:hypothetical protein